MKLQPSALFFCRLLPHFSGKEWKTLLSQEGSHWLFAFKTTLAALLALWISFRFQLTQPVTAVVTVFLLMQPQSGPVLTKSIYRILGTFSGAYFCLTLFSLFPQQRILFLTGLSVWIGLCTAGATLYRNFICYAFVLAGYTAAMVGMTNVANPYGFFDYAVGRCSEVMVGIICSGLVSDLLFPQSVRPAIHATLKQAYAQFTGFTHLVLSDRGRGQGSRPQFLRFINLALTIEAFRCSAYWEAAPLRKRQLGLRRLNADFMGMTTAAYSLKQLIDRLAKSGSQAGALLDTLFAELDTTMVQFADTELSLPMARSAVRQLKCFDDGIPSRAVELLGGAGIESQDAAALDMETGIALLRRLTGKWQDFLDQYQTILQPKQEIDEIRRTHFSPRTDPLIALLNGIRAALAVFLVALFWIATGWPYGNYAVMMVAIACSLFAPIPAPIMAINMGLYGGCVALPIAFVCKFFLMPSVNGFPLLCAILGPILLLSAWLMGLSKKTMMVGLGFLCMFCFMIAPNNSMVYEPIKMVNFGLSQVCGQAAASVMFALFFPVNSPWLKRRIPKMLRHQIVIACTMPLPQLGARFESGTRDIMQRIAATGNEANYYDRTSIDWMFIVLEIGRAVIHLRRDGERLQQENLQQALGKILLLLAELFDHPTRKQCQLVLNAVDQAIDAVRSTAQGQDQQSDVLVPILASLHSIRITLLDSETVFWEEVDHAPRICPA